MKPGIPNKLSLTSSEDKDRTDEVNDFWVKGQLKNYIGWVGESPAFK